jgi:hypothetical protein
MTEIVNLRRVRKQRARAEAAADAARNRALHGRTAAQKAQEHLEQSQARQSLDGHLMVAARPQTPECHGFLHFSDGPAESDEQGAARAGNESENFTPRPDDSLNNSTER